MFRMNGIAASVAACVMAASAHADVGVSLTLEESGSGDDVKCEVDAALTSDFAKVDLIYDVVTNETFNDLCRYDQGPNFSNGPYCDDIFGMPRACSSIQSVTVRRIACETEAGPAACGAVTLAPQDFAFEMAPDAETRSAAEIYVAAAQDDYFFDELNGCDWIVATRFSPPIEDAEMEFDLEIFAGGERKGVCYVTVSANSRSTSCNQDPDAAPYGCADLDHVSLGGFVCRAGETERDCGEVSVRATGVEVK